MSVVCSILSIVCSIYFRPFCHVCLPSVLLPVLTSVCSSYCRPPGPVSCLSLSLSVVYFGASSVVCSWHCPVCRPSHWSSTLTSVLCRLSGDVCCRLCVCNDLLIILPFYSCLFFTLFTFVSLYLYCCRLYVLSSVLSCLSSLLSPVCTVICTVFCLSPLSYLSSLSYQSSVLSFACRLYWCLSVYVCCRLCYRWSCSVCLSSLLSPAPSVSSAVRAGVYRLSVWRLLVYLQSVLSSVTCSVRSVILSSSFECRYCRPSLVFLSVWTVACLPRCQSSDCLLSVLSLSHLVWFLPMDCCFLISTVACLYCRLTGPFCMSVACSVCRL